MLTHMSHEDIQHLQSVGRDAQAARAEYILRDDQEKVWQHLTSLADKTDSRIDFVLDNGLWYIGLRLAIPPNDVYSSWIRSVYMIMISLSSTNRAFQLFTDFVFADFLVTYTPYASKVIFQ